jgi:predicted aspartyl protease
LAVVAIAMALPIIVGANSTPESARSEIQLQLADLLLDDERYWEAISAYDRAKRGAKPEQLLRATKGLLRSLIQVAEFNRAHEEARSLGALAPEDAPTRSLYADGLWAAGLFEEAEAVYEDILVAGPDSIAARHGLGRSFAAKNDLERALTEVQASLTADAPPEYHHTLGMIYRRLKRYPEAADAFERYVERLPVIRQMDRSEWTRSEIRFLRSFGDLQPVRIAGDPNQIHTIPFQLVNDKIIVRGRVNGGDLIDLVMDTGAEQMVLSKPTAEALGIRPITNTISAGVGDAGFRGLELGRADSLEVATLVVENLPVVVKNPPLTGLPTTRVPDAISPLALGLSFVIDYQTRQLTLARDLPDEPADIELPMRVHRLPLIRGVVNQEFPKSFVIDTGGEVISISLGTARGLQMRPSRHIPLRVFGTSGWDQEAFLLPGVNLAFSGIMYENFSVVVLNLHRPSALLGFHIGGIVGYRFLRDYRVSLDMRDSVVRLNRIKALSSL